MDFTSIRISIMLKHLVLALFVMTLAVSVGCSNKKVEHHHGHDHGAKVCCSDTGECCKEAKACCGTCSKDKGTCSASGECSKDKKCCGTCSKGEKKCCGTCSKDKKKAVCCSDTGECCKK